MDARRVPVVYQEYVVAPDLERTALFEALRRWCARRATVLYPGSSVHVTPSFFFQHVVYVDRSELSRAFFGQPQAVLDVVNARRRYRERPFIRFLAQDFTAALPLPEGSFDVLLALYTGGISTACARYVKQGGILVTNNHHGDARDAAQLPDFELHGVIEGRRGEVRFVADKDLDRCVHPAGRTRPGRRVAPEMDYYVFRRFYPRRCPGGQGQ